MAFDLLFDNPTVSIPTVSDIENEWVNVPDKAVHKFIAREHQYLKLHAILLTQLRHTKNGDARNPAYKHKLDHNLRAGFIKAALLIAASICEAVLRSHAEKRGYSLPQKKRRTFGAVLHAWKGKADVSGIYSDLQGLKDIRNNIHLFVAASSPSRRLHAGIGKGEGNANNGSDAHD